MAKKSQKTLETVTKENTAIDQSHKKLFLWFCVVLPIAVYHGLQFLHSMLADFVEETVFSNSGEFLFAMLLNVFQTVIDFSKMIAPFVALGILFVRMTRRYGSRLTKIGATVYPVCVLVSYTAAIWMTAYFEYLNSAAVGYHAINILLNWILDLCALGAGVGAIILCRAKVWKREDLTPKEEWLPRKRNFCLRSVMWVTLAMSAVRLLVCLYTTVSALIAEGTPQNAGEVWELSSPYLTLAAQTLIGYLIMVQIVRSAQQKEPVEEKPFSCPWRIAKKK